MDCGCGCGRLIVGKSSKKYASDACKQRAYEARIKQAKQAKARTLTMDEWQIWRAIETYVGDEEQMQMLGRQLTLVERSQWQATLLVVETALELSRLWVETRNQEKFSS